MKLKVINMDGKEVKDIEISDKIFSLKPNDCRAKETVKPAKPPPTTIIFKLDIQNTPQQFFLLNLIQ